MLRPRAARGPAGLASAWLGAYVAIWGATLAAAGTVAVGGRALAVPVRRMLQLTLSASHNPPPQIWHIVALAAHNIPIAAWPLLLGRSGAARHRLARHAADCLLAACLLANTLPVGAALGAYGTALIAYIPQLPLEWAGLALGAACWLRERQRPLRPRESLTSLALIGAALLCAAIAETTCVPHR